MDYDPESMFCVKITSKIHSFMANFSGSSIAHSTFAAVTLGNNFRHAP